MVFKQTSGWIVGLVLFGLLVPSINNWGHGGGVLAGAGLAWLLGYSERSRETLLRRALPTPFYPSGRIRYIADRQALRCPRCQERKGWAKHD
jgi:hypothetical protein